MTNMMSKQRIDVFISSTSIDLPEHRRAVTEAIISLGLFPSGMETWPVGDESSVDLCKRKVADAEIYLGVYAHRYGWRPEGFGGKSITELEYDWATERGIPRLCFVMSDSHPWPKDKMELDGLDALNAFKARVKQNQVGFFTTPDDLKAQVIAALAPYAQRDSYTQALPYLRWLHEQSQSSGLLRLLRPRDATADTQSVTVDQVYTPLDTRQLVSRDAEGRPLPANVERLIKRVSGSDDSEQTPLTAMEAASLFPQLVLLGDPGSGKSTFLSYLTLCLTGQMLESEAGWLARLEAQGWEQGERLPIVVTLRDFAQDVPPDAVGTASLLFGHIERQLARWKLEKALPVLQRALDTGRALVLLDGLDEVPPGKRDLIRDTIADFSARYGSGSRLIVTCRILSYTNPEWRIPNLVEQTIALFDSPKIKHFVEAWYTALQALRDLDAETAAQRVAELSEGLNNPRLQAVAANPMLLTVMAIVHNHTGTLPRESAKLYQQCVDLLMLRWKPQEARSLMEVLDVREDDLYRLLWEIAYDAHDKQAEREGAADISEAAILGISRKRLGGDTAKAAEFCEYVEKRAGLLIGRGQDAYGMRVFTFPHRTFQEFLAGCHVASERFNRRMPELARRGTSWREALLLATGHLVFNRGDIATPLDTINAMCPERLKPQTDDEWRVVWLAGDMLALIGLANVEGDEVGREVLPRVRQRLADLVSGGHLPPVERAAVGRLLSGLGDPRPGVGLKDGLPDIDWVDIPAGEFIFGDESEDNGPKKLKLPAFAISRHLITYAQFQTFIDAPDGFSNPEWWQGLELPEGHNAAPDEQWFKYWNHPRDDVSWYDAIAFCRWLSARLGVTITLPTEQQYERAARWTDGRLYPWGNAFDPALCNTGESGIGQTTAVGIYPQGASVEGVLDLSGNVWEWCLNKYHESEDIGINGTDVRVVRGGAWDNNADLARAVFRNLRFPAARNLNRGFRCARS